MEIAEVLYHLARGGLTRSHSFSANVEGVLHNRNYVVLAECILYCLPPTTRQIKEMKKGRKAENEKRGRKGEQKKRRKG